MVQYNLPKAEKRREPQGPQVAGLVSGARDAAPQLAKYLAEWLLKRNVDPREIYKQTGYIQDTTTGELIYSFGDQGMKVRADNPLLAPPEEPDLSGGSFNKAARVYEKPGIPMKEGDAGYKVQREQIVPRHENDPIGERVRNPKAVMPSGAEISRARYGYPGQTKPGEELVWSDPTGMDQPPGSLPTSEFGLPSDVKDPNQMGFWDLPSDVWGDPVGHDFLSQNYAGSRGGRRSNVSSTPTFEELFTHPLQEQYTPELGGIPVTARYTDSAGNYSGRYFGGDNPGDVSKATASAEGQVGGVDVMNSMPSVALHEVGAHGGQNLFGWHRGGSSSENWMVERGQELRRQAAQAQTDLINQKAAVIDRLMAGHGLDRSQYNDAIDMYDELFPGYYDRMDRYRDTERAAVSTPEYTAYQHEGGEAAGRNFQTRAQDLTSDVPMTKPGGLERWDQFSGGSENAFDPSLTANLGKRHEGDVHPLETYDVAPDLMRQRVVTKSDAPLSSKEVRAFKQHDVKPVDQNTYMAESQPLRSQFDWLLSKAPAPAAAATVGGAALAASDPASASEAQGATSLSPMADRLPAASPVAAKQDRLPASQEGRIKEAGQMFAEVPQAMTTGLREAGESALGMGGDMGEYLPGIGPAVTASKALLPSWANPFKTTEDAASMTDWLQGYLPEGAQATAKEWTQHEDTSPMDWMYRNIVSNVVDPVDIGLATAGKKLGRVALAKLKGLF